MQSSKVLLLENVAAQAAAARNALVGAGYRLVISRFEAEGLKRAKEWQPDIVVLSNAYPKESLSSFCRLLRVETGRHVKIIIASSLTPDRLLKDDPELKSIADGFVLRPYSAVRLREVLDRLADRKRPAAGGTSGIEGRRVLLVDGDPDVLRVLRENLDPLGAVVDTATWGEAAAHCSRRPPQAIILEWPTPEGFDIETLRRMHDGGGGEVKTSILLVSAAGQDIVRSQSPALLNMASMFFTRPVAWSHFVRFLVNLLERTAAVSEESAPPPPVPPPASPPAGGSDMEKRFQEELEAKFLEVEELKRSLKTAREEADHRTVDGAEFGRLQEESARLTGRLEEARREGEVELGKMRLREADLEVKLGNIIRKKSEAERRAQDQLDTLTIRAEEAERTVEEAFGEIQLKEEQAVALRSDMERILVEKESTEEQLESALAEAQRDRKAIEASMEKSLAASREELGAAKTREEELKGELEQLQKVRSEETGRERGLADRIVELEEVIGEKQEALSSLEEVSAEKDETLTSLEAKVKAGEEAASVLEEKLRESEESVAGLEEKVKQGEAAAAGLEEKLQRGGESVADLEEKLHQSELAVAGLDEEMSGLRQSWAESEAAAADVTAREAKLAREMEELLGDLGEIRESLASSRSREEELRRQVGEGEGEAERLRDEVDFLLKRLEAEEKTTAQRAAELERLKAEPSEAWAGRIGEAEAVLARKEEELGRAEEKIVLTGAFASELEAKIGHVEKAAEEAGRKEAEQRDAALAAEDRAAGSEGERDRLAGELAKAKEEGTRAAGDLGELRESLRNLERRLEERDVQIAALGGDLEKSLAQKADAGGKLRAALADGEGEREKIAELRGEQERGRELLAALETSLQEERDRLDRERGAREKAEGEHRAALDGERARLREVEEKLSAITAKAAAAEATGKEYQKLQQLLQDVTARAQSEVIERSRGESELQERLKASVEEKKFLLRRLEKEVDEAAQREKRLTDLLDNALQGAAQARSAQPDRSRESLPVIVSTPTPPAEPARIRPFIAAVAILGTLAFLAWMVVTLRPSADSPARRESAPAPLAAAPGKAGEESADTVAAERDVWEQWSRSDVSGGVLFQATLRSAEEVEAEVRAEQRSQGWNDERTASELAAMLEPYRFEENIYFYLYLKNLQPGYPAYADDIYAHLTLRDDKGNEASAFIPPDMEKYRRVYSFTSGELSKSRDELVYEVTVPVAFARSDLGPRPRYIELLAYNIGASSRRVLTWELQ